MRIHALQHVPFEPPGSIEAWAKRAGHALAVTHLHRGDPLPVVNGGDLLVVLGGPMSVHDEARYPWLVDEKRFIERTIAAGRRVLGICLGAQLIAHVLGARVHASDEKEIGWFAVEATAAARNAAVFEEGQLQSTTACLTRGVIRGVPGSHGAKCEGTTGTWLRTRSSGAEHRVRFPVDLRADPPPGRAARRRSAPPSP